MTFDYEKAARVASELIELFGRTAILKSFTETGPSYSPTRTATEDEVTVVDLNQQVTNEAGTLVGASQRTLYVSVQAGVEPLKDDRVLIGTAEHQVTDVRPLNPGGTVVMYEVDLAG